MQFKDGSRKKTKEWTWKKAEDVAYRKAAELEGVSSTPVKSTGYPVERAVEEWIAERGQDALNNTKAKYLSQKLLDWCHRNGIEYLGQIEKQALRVWRSTEWKYRNGDSSSLKVHWSVLCCFFRWCVEGDLLDANPCPKRKGKIKQRRVIPLKENQIDALLAAVERMRRPGWTEERRLKMRALILIMRWGGMALIDAVCLLRSELVGQVVHSQRHKTKKAFSVPIPKWVADLLQLLPNNDPRYFFWHLSANGSQPKRITNIFGGWFHEVFKEAGITGHSHQLRHSFATHHLARKVRVERVAEWMGDSPAEVRHTYEHWIIERQEVSEQAMRESWKGMGLDEVGNPIPPQSKTIQ